jgi:hypothetical protein
MKIENAASARNGITRESIESIARELPAMQNKRKIHN